MKKIRPLSFKSFMSYSTKSLANHINRVCNKEIWVMYGNLAYFKEINNSCTGKDHIDLKYNTLKLYGVMGSIDHINMMALTEEEYLILLKGSLYASNN